MRLDRAGRAGCGVRGAGPPGPPGLSTPLEAGVALHSGMPKCRHPGNARYAGKRGISRGLRAARSRKVPLCGPNRDMGAPRALIV
jgi:hypothetical protein